MERLGSFPPARLSPQPVITIPGANEERRAWVEASRGVPQQPQTHQVYLPETKVAVTLIYGASRRRPKAVSDSPALCMISCSPITPREP